jgi:uncharacterized protein YdaU (DUF1376 family)
MARDPAFLFYYQDFLVGTMTMTLEQKGAYITIMCLQAAKGHLSCDGIILALNRQDLWDAIRSKFVQDKAGLWYNVRLDEEMKKRAEHSKKQKINASLRWHKNGTQPGNATALPLEDEDENAVVSSESSGGRGGVGEKDLTHPDDIPSEPPKEVESKQRAIKYMLEVLRLDLYQIEKLIEQYGVDYTMEKIELVQKNARNIKNPVQYFVAAMKSNYVDTDRKAKTEAEALAADRIKKDLEWLNSVKVHLEEGKTIKPETFDRLPAGLQAELVYDQEHYKKTLEWRYIHSKFRPDLVKAAEEDK